MKPIRFASKEDWAFVRKGSNIFTRAGSGIGVNLHGFTKHSGYVDMLVATLVRMD